MIKKISTFFTDAGTPKTGLTPTIRIRDLNTDLLVVTDAVMTETGDGFYAYNFTTYDENSEYSIRCDGGVTLTSAFDRYTYAGNESYQEDILDTPISTHSIVGSVGAAILGNLGAPTSSSHSGGITKRQAEDIARLVWEYMFTNDQNAQEVLMSRSEFNHIKDTVLLSDKNVLPESFDYSKELSVLQKSVGDLSKNITVLSKKDTKVSVVVPDSLVKEINLITKNLSDFYSKVDNTMSSISPAINSTVSILEQSVGSLDKKVDGLSVQLSSNNLDLSKADELAVALNTLKDSLTTIMMVAEKMSGDTEARRAIKKSLVNLTDLKFRMLNSNLRR